MQQVNDIRRLRALLKAQAAAGRTIGFVPTMGHLHEGHLSLVRRAATQADFVVVSIFVNPLQFDRQDDLDAYPRTLEQDARLLETVGVNLLYAPEPESFYPCEPALLTRIEVPGITERLEGASRPGHFSGVATVVNRLFNLIQPDIAFFGEKDYQQLRMIEKMVDDLAIPVSIMSEPTVREADGLALSSRNTRLSDTERQTAPRLHETLTKIAEVIRLGGRDFRKLEAKGVELLQKEGFSVDYLEICRQGDLQPAEPGDADLIVLVAAWLGSTRLIDNLKV